MRTGERDDVADAETPLGEGVSEELRFGQVHGVRLVGEAIVAVAHLDLPPGVDLTPRGSDPASQTPTTADKPEVKRMEGGEGRGGGEDEGGSGCCFLGAAIGRRTPGGGGGWGRPRGGGFRTESPIGPLDPQAGSKGCLVGGVKI